MKDCLGALKPTSGFSKTAAPVFWVLPFSRLHHGHRNGIHQVTHGEAHAGEEQLRNPCNPHQIKILQHHLLPCATGSVG